MTKSAVCGFCQPLFLEKDMLPETRCKTQSEAELASLAHTLKNGWVFEDFTQFQRRENLIPAGQSS